MTAPSTAPLSYPLSPWETAGVRATVAPLSPTLTLPQRGRE